MVEKVKHGQKLVHFRNKNIKCLNGILMYFFKKQLSELYSKFNVLEWELAFWCLVFGVWFAKIDLCNCSIIWLKLQGVLGKI